MINPDDPTGPKRNRVAPDSRLIATPTRGLFFGNRGRLHNHAGLAPKGDGLRWAGRRWIICLTRYKNWRRPLTPPGGYSALFFLDEATALAAGHRPCALCQRGAYDSFKRRAGVADLSADSLDLRLHAERLDGRTRRLHALAWRDLPAGAITTIDGAPYLALPDRLAPWRPEGYGPPIARPTGGRTWALTPPTSLAALREGLDLKLHRSAKPG
jgi:hypothetical protein